MKKKVWSKPRLVVLVRGKPAEAVLNGCKAGHYVVDPYGLDDGCHAWDPACDYCLTYTGS